jgi:hypothetical protein
MFENLGKIENPFARSTTAAFTTLSVITLASSIAIGATKPEDKSAYAAAVYSSLIGAGCGAFLGLVYSGGRNQQNNTKAIETEPEVAPTEGNIWKDWRNFVVIRKVKESEEITSFYLQPQDNGELPEFQPGQFLTIKLNIPGQTKPVIRTYSLSDYPDRWSYYRLSIKREPAPQGVEVPPGVASNFMHDHVDEGSIILAKPPSGNFILDVQKTIPAVFISNGVGITPMISMAKAATRLNLERPLWFIHGARDGRYHAFREEVRAIAAQNPNLRTHFVYSRPREEDSGYYHSTGYVDTELIQSLVMQEAEYFLCGSPPFLASMRQGLQDAGVPESRVFFEMFTRAAKVTNPPAPAETSSDRIDSAAIVFAQSDRTITWEPDADSILEFAEANDLNPPYSCRQGICGTCQCKLLEGEVEYQETPTAEIEDGAVLICISKPKTSTVVLDL